MVSTKKSESETKKSKLHEFLLKEGVGTTPEYGNLSSYLAKKIVTKVSSKSDKVQTEAQVISECKKYLLKEGWVWKTIYTGGIPTSGGSFATNPSKGIPDCICFHTKTNKMMWIEFKKSKGGIISQEQKDWHNLLRNSGQVVYVINSLSLLKEKLNESIGSN